MTHSSEFSTPYTDTPDDHLIEGFDPEVAADLGMAVDYESREQQVDSGRRVAQLLGEQAAVTSSVVDGQAEHDAVVEAEGPVTCANCNEPGCPGCGRS